LKNKVALENSEKKPSKSLQGTNEREWYRVLINESSPFLGLTPRPPLFENKLVGASTEICCHFDPSLKFYYMWTRDPFLAKTMYVFFPPN
jgi:hypothetical protein